MPQKYDLCSMGELLIDFTPQGKSDNGNDLYECNPGGAPANVLVMFSKLGGKAAFIGKVGKDGFGFYLKKVLEQYGINCDGLIMAEERRTNLAFVHLDEKGDRSFSFYRDGGFDLMLKIMREEINPEALKNCGIFHFGSLSLTDSISRSTTYYAIKTARESGSLISFDPNYREMLWKNPEEAREEIIKVMGFADILKVSKEEMALICGEKNPEKGIYLLKEFSKARVIFVTMGSEGAYYMNSLCGGCIPAYKVRAVDTTGAGDAFVGALLYRLKGKSKKEISFMEKEELENIVKFANAAGSLTTTGTGAIPALPDTNAINEIIKNNRG